MRERAPRTTRTECWSSEQRKWMHSLLNPGQSNPWLFWSGGVREVEAAAALHINNIRANLIAALSTTYPSVKHAMGGQRFASLVVQGLRRNPPSSGDLSIYGAALPHWISDFLAREGASEAINQLPQRDDLVWLARLEWAVDQSRSANSASPWTLGDAVEDFSRPDWLSARTRLRGPWKIWTLSASRIRLLADVKPHIQVEWLSRDHLKSDLLSLDTMLKDETFAGLLQQGQRVALLRSEELTWFSALNAGCNIEYATELVLAKHPQWEADTILRLCLSHQLLLPLQYSIPYA